MYLIISLVDDPGPKIASIPMSFHLGISSSGIIPPAIIFISSAPLSLSREELWEELSTKKCLKHVPEEKVTLFKDILRGEHIYSPSELTDSITYGDGEYPFTLIALEKLNKEINLNLRRAFKKCFLN